MWVTEEDRSIFKKILDDLGTSQLQLAKDAGVNRSWLNQVLGGRRKKRIDGERLDRVATRLIKMVKESKSLPPDRIDSAVLFLSRFSHLTSGRPKLFQPGGPVPVDAAHYIRREADLEIDEALRQSFSMLVTGPVQCGKSSLLARLGHKATDIGIETVSFDPASVHVDFASNSDDEINSAVALSLAETLSSRWRFEGPAEIKPNSVQRLFQWLVRGLEPSKARDRLLIIDDLGQLGSAGDIWFQTFFRALSNERAGGGPRISFAVGITQRYDLRFIRRWMNMSSSLAWWPRIDLSWFSLDEVKELCRLVSKDSPAGRVHEVLGGQPYLTHAACVDRAFWHAVEMWTNRPLEERARSILGSQPFRRHTAALRQSILGPNLVPSTTSQEILAAIGMISQRKGAQVEGSSSDIISFLQKAQIVNSRNEAAIELYRLVAQELTERNQV